LRVSPARPGDPMNLVIDPLLSVVVGFPVLPQLDNPTPWLGMTKTGFPLVAFPKGQ
jgi:hypothetical protein